MNNPAEMPVDLLDAAGERRKEPRIPIPTEKIDRLRGRIFGSIIDLLCDKNLPKVQKAIGVWPWHDDVPVPERRSITMFCSGTMNFNVKTTAGNIFFGFWMFPGEVRMGFRLPHALASECDEVVRYALDGQITPCPRIVDMGHLGKFYDWIFRDSFAGMDLWIRAMEDENAAAAIADSIRSIAVHLYMSAINAVVESGGMILNGEGTLIQRSETVDCIMDFDCQEEESVAALEEAGLHLVASFPQPGSHSLAIVRIESDGPIEAIEDALVRFPHGYTIKVL